MLFKCTTSVHNVSFCRFRYIQLGDVRSIKRVRCMFVYIICVNVQKMFCQQIHFTGNHDFQQNICSFNFRWMFQIFSMRSLRFAVQIFQIHQYERWNENSIYFTVNYTQVYALGSNGNLWNAFSLTFQNWNDLFIWGFQIYIKIKLKLIKWKSRKIGWEERVKYLNKQKME